MIQRSTFFKKDQTVKINKINKVYDEPLLKLVHHRHLELKVNSPDLSGKRRKKWGTKRYVLLIVGSKWKLEIIWGTIESNKPFQFYPQNRVHVLTYY